MWGLPVCPLPRVLSRRNGPTNCWSALGPGGVSFCILTAKTHATAVTSHWHGPDDCVPVVASPRIRQYWRGSPCSGGSARADAAPRPAARPPATRTHSFSTATATATSHTHFYSITITWQMRTSNHCWPSTYRKIFLYWHAHFAHFARVFLIKQRLSK